jgi:hypothetical protein
MKNQSFYLVEYYKIDGSYVQIGEPIKKETLSEKELQDKIEFNYYNSTWKKLSKYSNGKKRESFNAYSIRKNWGDIEYYLSIKLIA